MTPDNITYYKVNDRICVQSDYREHAIRLDNLGIRSPIEGTVVEAGPVVIPEHGFPFQRLKVWLDHGAPCGLLSLEVCKKASSSIEGSFFNYLLRREIEDSDEGRLASDMLGWLPEDTTVLERLAEGWYQAKRGSDGP